MLELYRGCLLCSKFLILLAVCVLSFTAATAWSAPQAQYSPSCSDCHGMPPLDSLYRNVTTGAFKGNHQRHATSAVSTCERCHPGSASFTYSHMTSIVLLSANINSSPAGGQYKIGGNQVTFYNLTSYPVMGTCSNVNCHFETVTPQWGSPNYSSATDCSGCHSVPGPSSSHAKHDRYYRWATNGCTKCHSDYKTGLFFSHATSAGQRGISVILAEGSYSGDGLNYLPSQSGSRNLGDCANLYCHSPGTKANGYDTPNQVPQWGTSLTCSGCHKSDVVSGDRITSPVGGYGHDKHVNATISSSFGCVRCHSATVFNNISISSKTDHVDKFVTIRFNNSTTAVSGTYNGNNASGVSYKKTPGNAPGSCRNVYCHSYGSSAVAPFSVMSTPTWGSAIPVNCTACHGGDNTRPASRQMATGKHARHMGGASNYSFGCAECHKDTAIDNTTIGTAANHVNYRINVAFNATWGGTYSTDGHKPGAASGTCNNLYCHSDGKATSPTYVSQPWSGTLNCSGCHGNATSNTLSGKHQSHVNNAAVIGTNYGCVGCHALTVSDNSTISDQTKHVNKLRDYSGARAGKDYSAGVCTNVYCHSDGKTVYKSMASTAWTSAATLDCKGCHGADAAPAFASKAGEPNYVSGAAGSAAANSHQNHVSVATDCVKCHRRTTSTGTAIISGSADHIDRTIDVRFSKLNGFTSYSGVYGSDKGCSSTYCHSASTPKWGANGTITCESCHKANNQLPGLHIRHWAGANVATSYTDAPANIGTTNEYRFSCSSCHGFTLSHHVSGPVSTSAAAEIYFGFSSGNRRGVYSYGGVVITDGSFNWTNGTCSNTYCHSNGNGGPANTNSFDWSGGALGCDSCHSYTSISTGNHAKHIAAPYYMGCEKCHNATTTEGGVFDKTKHVNKVKDVVWNSLNPSSSPYVNSTTICGNIYCHSNGTSAAPPYGAPINTTFTWAVAGAVGCTGCHGDATTAGKLLSTGKHQKHINNQSVLGTNFGCVDCHVKTVSGNTTISNYTKHVNGFKDYSGISAGGSASLVGNVCTNIYCHSSGKRGVAGITEPVNPNWTSGGPLDCKGCHGLDSSIAGEPAYTSEAAGSPGANSHAKHVGASASCIKCHFRTTTTGAAIVSGSARHIDRTIDVNFSKVSSFTSYSGVYNSAARTCSNTYCHGGTKTSPAWGGIATCNTCHRSTPGSGSLQGAHAYHIFSSASNYNYTQAAASTGSTSAYNFTCASCHGNTLNNHAGGPVASGSDATIFFGFSSTGRGASANSAYTRLGTTTTDVQGFSWKPGGNGACNNTYCHSNGNNGNGALSTLNWGSAKTGACTVCHGDATSNTLSGKHQQHVNNAAVLGTNNSYSCIDCHANTVSSNTVVNDKTKHINKFKDYSGVKAGRNYNTATKSCTSFYCHSDGNAGALVYVNPPVWNTSSVLGCNGCHGTGKSVGYPDYTNGGAASVTSNSHFVHFTSIHVLSTTACALCHNRTVNASTANKLRNYSTLHINQAKDVSFGGTFRGTVVSATWTAGTATCTSISCHASTDAIWGGTACLDCHSKQRGHRAAIKPQFSAQSHHIQGRPVTNADCYWCHMEADASGFINYAFHNGSSAKKGTVDLVLWAAGSRSAVYIKYTASGSRTQMAKINQHCLGCHSSTDPAFQPFGDGKSPSEYSWEAKPTTAGGFGAAQDIASKYNSTTTTLWGKFTGGNTNVNNKSSQTKAYSAHGNAAANQRGWSTLAENLQAPTAVANFPNTSGTGKVLCYDCHNSHGSSISLGTANAVTSSYSSATGNYKGGILKATTAGVGGYAVSYRAYSGGNATQKNRYNAGAGICFDCHNNANAGTPTYAGNITPWGYNTFGATQMIHGYNDNPYFGKTGATFPKGVTYPFLVTGGLTVNKGGHLHASSPMTTTPGRTINGLCTGCHDPHGVSNALAAADRQYAVPLLKGTFVTSPYKQDIAPANTNEVRGGGSEVPPLSVGSTPGYHIDQNTMQLGTTGKPSSSRYWAFATTATTLQTLNDTQFAGLCLGCHSKASLNNTAAATTSNWKTMTRIHNTVNGWALTSGTGGNVNNKVHAFTCSKCHSPHNSNLPRLLVTNCLDVKHRGRVTTGGATGLMITTSGSRGAGLGRFPGGGSYGHSRNATTATNPGPWFFGKRTTTLVTTANLITTTRCHDSATAGGSTWTTNGSTQYWNTKSLW